MYVAISVTTKVHAGMEKIPTGTMTFKVEVPENIANQILAAPAKLKTELPKEHVEITVTLHNANGELVR
ncbi:MAG: hypothetical protein AAB515_02665 [Patescibacteria group bacterium]